MPDDIHGNLKLFGFDGFVQGEVWTIQEGNSIVIGKSKDCDICLVSLANYQEIDPDKSKIEMLLKSVSNEHLRITYNSTAELIITNLSGSNCYLNDRKIMYETIITDITRASYMLTFGTSETLQFFWTQLIYRKKMKIIELPEDEIPPEGAIEIGN